MRNDSRILKLSSREIEKDKSLSEKERKERIRVVERMLKEKNIEKRYSKLYDMICQYLDDEFINKNICGFSNDICSRRRCMMEKKIEKDTYRNGCCHSYKENKDCEHLKDGRCSIKNIACKTFTCPYLRLQGKNYSVNKIYFAKYFFNFRQKLYMETTYFVDKDVVMKGILKRR